MTPAPLVRFTVCAVAGAETLPNASRGCTVAIALHPPAASVCGGVVNANRSGAPAVTVSAWFAGFRPAAVAVSGSGPAVLPRK